ncbi:GGDEF domain-containing protein [Novosphingobium bradum]|uniref:diguanylate cyclase n=1 Tax=Novosphingobium bradum TaxID=1737444 RepID=A0ABV7IL48_9SPHN
MDSANLPAAPRPLLQRLAALFAGPTAPPAETPPSAEAPASAAALRAQVAALGDFLAENHLHLSHTTLCVALDCVSGNDPRLSGAIAHRRAAGEPVTFEWLAEMRGHHGPADELQSLTRLTDRLEDTVDVFTRTTQEAGRATSAYRTALGSQVAELQQGPQAGAVLSDLVAITRAMLERTREIEGQFARSEKQTRALHRSLEDARRAAEIDHLTGLPNRRSFESRFEREVVAARAAGEPLCLAFADIDRFKRINDTHGHEAGDRVLKVVAAVLGEISDDRCHVARHGGEEFVVLLRGRTMDQAFALLDSAREHLAERRMVNRATDVPFGKVTFSAGLADVFATSDPRAALKAADTALYAAKKDGRNRIVRAPVEPAPGTPAARPIPLRPTSRPRAA